ncbi:zinc-ribbon domain-containing protein [Haloplanus natans]|uniref:zinc-ribbon domain-containing protein n=1 Tax=Haloplanus natans TaxID=376171 RepID=UPI0006777574|nr:zinc-ribbon domain-containing protein [Haloplanus natans]
MGLLNTITDTFKASTPAPNRSEGADESTGAYWCHDCGERILDTEVDGDDAPTCPDCGEAMELERSPGSTGCAC